MFCSCSCSKFRRFAAVVDISELFGFRQENDGQVTLRQDLERRRSSSDVTQNVPDQEDAEKTAEEKPSDVFSEKNEVAMEK